MYQIGLSNTYGWPVEVQHAKDGGGFEKRTFDIEFQRFDQDGIDDLGARAKDGRLGDKEFCREVVTGWRGVAGANKEELVFSQGNLEMLLKVPGMAAAIVRAFYASLRGEREKN